MDLKDFNKIKIGNNVKIKDGTGELFSNKIGTISQIFYPSQVNLRFKNDKILMHEYDFKYYEFDLFEEENIASIPIKSKECPCGIFRGDCTYHC